MSVQLQIEEMSGYLAARFAGEGVADEVLQQFALIAEHCKRTNNKRLLIDVTAAHNKNSVGGVSSLVRFNFAEKSQAFAGHTIKVAVVARSEHLDTQRFGELVARNRGVNLRGFTDLQTAEEWLSG